MNSNLSSFITLITNNLDNNNVNTLTTKQIKEHLDITQAEYTKCCKYFKSTGELVGRSPKFEYVAPELPDMDRLGTLYATRARAHSFYSSLCTSVLSTTCRQPPQFHSLSELINNYNLISSIENYSTHSTHSTHIHEEGSFSGKRPPSSFNPILRLDHEGTDNVPRGPKNIYFFSPKPIEFNKVENKGYYLYNAYLTSLTRIYKRDVTNIPVAKWNSSKHRATILKSINLFKRRTDVNPAIWVNFFMRFWPQRYGAGNPPSLSAVFSETYLTRHLPEYNLAWESAQLSSQSTLDSAKPLIDLWSKCNDAVFACIHHIKCEADAHQMYKYIIQDIPEYNRLVRLAEKQAKAYLELSKIDMKLGKFVWT